MEKLQRFFAAVYRLESKERALTRIWTSANVPGALCTDTSTDRLVRFRLLCQVSHLTDLTSECKPSM